MRLRGRKGIEINGGNLIYPQPGIFQVTEQISEPTAVWHKDLYFLLKHATSPF